MSEVDGHGQNLIGSGQTKIVSKSFIPRWHGVFGEGQVNQNEILSGSESTHGPSQEMTERCDDGQNHGQNLTETRCVKPSPSHSF